MPRGLSLSQTITTYMHTINDWLVLARDIIDLKLDDNGHEIRDTFDFKLTRDFERSHSVQ